MREHFQNVQALRGLACLAVVVCHTWKLESEFVADAAILDAVKWFGFAGVDLFFVLSGFIITATNSRDLGRPAAVPGFLFRRFWRVYPTYWAAMAATLALLWALAGNDLYISDAGRGWPWWVSLAPSVIPNSLVGQAWTMCYEVMFYLAFGVVMLGPPRLAAPTLGGWAAVVIVGMFRPVPTSPLAAQLQSPFVLEFLGGCAVAWMIGRGFRRGWRSAIVLGLGYGIVGTVAVATTVTIPYGDAMAGQALRVLVFGPPAVLIVYGCVAAEGVWPRRVPAWLSRLGDASYSLYLIHPPALQLGKWAGVFVPHTRVPHLLWVAGTLLGVVGVGLLFHRWVERPLLALGKGRPRVRAEAASTPEAALRRAA